jgi:hypothetical protein
LMSITHRLPRRKPTHGEVSVLCRDCGMNGTLNYGPHLFRPCPHADGLRRWNEDHGIRWMLVSLNLLCGFAVIFWFALAVAVAFADYDAARSSQVVAFVIAGIFAVKTVRK